MLTLGEVAGQLPPCQILNPLFYLRHESVRLTVVLWRKVIKSDPWHTAWMLGLKARLLQPKKKPSAALEHLLTCTCFITRVHKFSEVEIVKSSATFDSLFMLSSPRQSSCFVHLASFTPTFLAWTFAQAWRSTPTAWASQPTMSRCVSAFCRNTHPWMSLWNLLITVKGTVQSPHLPLVIVSERFLSVSPQWLH